MAPSFVEIAQLGKTYETPTGPAIIVRDFTLVTQSHVPKGFRIGVPDDWTTQLDYSSPAFRADLFAHGPTISGVTVSTGRLLRPPRAAEA